MLPMNPEVEPSNEGHIPVLLAETIDLLQPMSDGQYVDGTLGGGGHAEAILDRSSPNGRLLGLDLDPDAVARVRKRFGRFKRRFVAINESFARLERIVRWEGFAPANGILLDLGLSSFQLASPVRGFTFRAEAPLDMRFDPHSSTPTAGDLLSRLSMTELMDLFRRYGEEPNARTIARAILERRERKQIETTTDLAAIIERAVGRRGRIHPATRVFQALRIAVNRELEALQEALPQAIELLAPGGRLAVISFHSLEDRMVKHFFSDRARTCICPPGLPICVCNHQPEVRIITRRGVRASDHEVAANPRSRSATLRVAERLATGRLLESQMHS